VGTPERCSNVSQVGKWLADFDTVAQQVAGATLGSRRILEVHRTVAESVLSQETIVNRYLAGVEQSNAGDRVGESRFWTPKPAAKPKTD